MLIFKFCAVCDTAFFRTRRDAKVLLERLPASLLSGAEKQPKATEARRAADCAAALIG